jgi:hypothetical protein
MNPAVVVNGPLHHVQCELQGATNTISCMIQHADRFLDAAHDALSSGFLALDDEPRRPRGWTLSCQLSCLNFYLTS